MAEQNALEIQNAKEDKRCIVITLVSAILLFALILSAAYGNLAELLICVMATVVFFTWLCWKSCKRDIRLVPKPIGNESQSSLTNSLREVTHRANNFLANDQSISNNTNTNPHSPAILFFGSGAASANINLDADNLINTHAINIEMGNQLPQSTNNIQPMV